MVDSANPDRRDSQSRDSQKSRRTRKSRGSKPRVTGGQQDDASRPPEPGDPGAPDPGDPDREEPEGPRQGPADTAGHHDPGPRGSPLAVTRRRLLVSGGGLAAAVAGLDALRNVARVPVRLSADSQVLDSSAASGPSRLPDIQFDIGALIPPAQQVDGVNMQFPPVFTVFAPARLRSAPTAADQQQLSDALARIEETYAFAPQGAFTFLSYGLPYFRRFPGWMFSTLVPRLDSDNGRFALEEAVPAPTDVSLANPGIRKQTFSVPVKIEQNDLLLSLRSDKVDNLWDILSFLAGSNRLGGEFVPSPVLSAGLTFGTARVMFVQRGMPRSVAEANNLPFASFVHPQSPMWMGFADQQADASAPAADVTFQGGGGIHMTTAVPGDYFDNGSLQHLAHDILDLSQFFDLDPDGKPGDDGTFLERVQYMFRAGPPPSAGNADQFSDGGGPAFVQNTFRGSGDAADSARGVGTLPDAGGRPEHRMGHTSTLQRSSRTASGQPIHQRMDGPGFDSLDVPDGSKQPKLQFSAFVPTADFFATMRAHQASLDLQAEFGVDPSDNGLERFITATRRQNFLIPPRRHRAFPFAELRR